MKNRCKAIPICLAIAAAFLFGPAQVNIAFGQEAQLEEIVVTARKREEAIQDIPLAITAFTAEELQKRSIQDMRDIALFTPGFNFEDFGGSGGPRQSCAAPPRCRYCSPASRTCRFSSTACICRAAT